MKVLFISRNKVNNDISPVVKNQGESLKESGLELNYYSIKGKGLKGYLKSIFQIRKHLKQNKYDIIHAHYSLSAIVTWLAGAKPLVASLMGDDIKSNSRYRFIIRFFARYFWVTTIVKSENMRVSLNLKNIDVIPNGVDLEVFKPVSMETALQVTGWNSSNKHVLFAANPRRKEKNFSLAKQAFELIENQNFELHYLDNVPNNKMPYYLNAADVVVLTSLREGSPNVIKEAMACNRPIVATDVGDVNERIKGIKGCYIVTMDPTDIADKMMNAINFGKTNGRNSIFNLDNKIIAKKIIKVYNEVISNN